MATLTEKTRNYEFLISTSNGDRSFGEQAFDSTTDWAGAEILAGTIYTIAGGVAVPFDGATASGIVLQRVAAGETDTRGVIVRDAVVKRYKLTDNGASDADVDTALGAVGIVARD